MSAKILVVEDNLTLQETIVYNLARNEYEVFSAESGEKALQLARVHAPQLILLDIMLPGNLDGYDVCRILRLETAAPIIMLTARGSEIDKVVGLEIGADDYLVKPVSMRHLLARVKARLRQVERDQQQVGIVANMPQHSLATTQLTFDNLLIDLGRHEVHLHGRVLHLKPKEYELLVFLARHRGIALSRDLILERVWEWRIQNASRTVDVHIRWLREKIESNPQHPQRIVTVRGVGYRFDG